VAEAADRPYQQAVDHLRRDHRIALSKQTLEALTQEIGGYWIERDAADFEALERQSRRADALPTCDGPAPDRCSIFADGVMVHSDGAWHEARVGTVRCERGDQVDKASVARLSDVPTFEKDLWRKAVQMGYHQAGVVAFIADGGRWLWNLADRNFDKAIRILDFYHLCQHVYACGDAFFGEGSDAARTWAVAVCGTLRAGQVDEALKTVEALPGRGKPRRAAKHDLVTYLTNNRDRMDYPRYEAMGLPIGSGEVEAQCKTLVQARCKQAGMRWTREGVESLLRVRCAVRDGTYEQRVGHWPVNFTAWQARRKRAA
jgi:hypothetical protein